MRHHSYVSCYTCNHTNNRSLDYYFGHRGNAGESKFANFWLYRNSGGHIYLDLDSNLSRLYSGF